MGIEELALSWGQVHAGRALLGSELEADETQRKCPLLSAAKEESGPGGEKLNGPPPLQS
jgi:hypothetical protein